MNDQTANTEQTKSKMINPVEMEDGRILDFGKGGQIKRTFTVGKNGFEISLDLITGKTLSAFVANDTEAYALLAQRGAAEYATNAVAGVYSDKDGLHPEDFELGVANALEQLASGQLVVRKAGEGVKGYGDLIRALQEIRSTLRNSDGNLRFDPAEATYDVCKKVILTSSEETNKARLRDRTYVALIEKYKLERQTARAAKAQIVAPGADAVSEELF